LRGHELAAQLPHNCRHHTNMMARGPALAAILLLFAAAAPLASAQSQFLPLLFSGDALTAEQAAQVAGGCGPQIPSSGGAAAACAPSQPSDLMPATCQAPTLTHTPPYELMQACGSRWTASAWTDLCWTTPCGRPPRPPLPRTSVLRMWISRVGTVCLADCCWRIDAIYPWLRLHAYRALAHVTGCMHTPLSRQQLCLQRRHVHHPPFLPPTTPAHAAVLANATSPATGPLSFKLFIPAIYPSTGAFGAYYLIGKPGEKPAVTRMLGMGASTNDGVLLVVRPHEWLVCEPHDLVFFCHIAGGAMMRGVEVAALHSNRCCCLRPAAHSPAVLRIGEHIPMSAGH